MARVGNIVLGVVGVVAIGAAIVAVRTATFKPPTQANADAVRLAPSIPIDNARAAEHLGEAVRIQTVSHQDPAEDQPAQWEALHQWLQATYPAAHRVMTRTIVAERTLVYEWPGADPSLAPIILMAHQDVVPVADGTEKDWRHPPFSGQVADGAVWGRGSIDDKGSLVSIFEAVDALAARGFRPRRTVYIVSGQDEETLGRGARAAAAWLAARGVMAEFTLDEGLLVIGDYPVTHGPVALIGVAEKGYATLKVTARSAGGHSSIPPKETGVITLAKALVAIAAHPDPMRYQGPAAQMMEAIAPHAPTLVRAAVANAWLFRPLLTQVIGSTPAGAAVLHTTTAPTMLQGSPKENVLPQAASGWINYRIAPGDSSVQVMARARQAVGSLPVELAWTRPPMEPTPVSSTRSEGWTLVAAAAAASSHAPVAPALVVAGTDSRALQPVSKDVYRFQPLVLSVNDTEMIHGTNEHMTLANLALMTDFYARLIATAAR
ncbi:MAG: M20 family peptidase [Caulobacteraceae bacterium]|nr:M20 family peptidase [Caulobacteraceae bacterium]